MHCRRSRQMQKKRSSSCKKKEKQQLLHLGHRPLSIYVQNLPVRRQHMHKTNILSVSSSSHHRSEVFESRFLARDCETHVVVEPKLLLSSSEEALELRVRQEGHWDDVSTPVLSNIDSEMAFGDIEGEAVAFIPMFLP